MVKVATVPPHVGQALGPHLVDGPARQADPGRRHVAEAAGRAGAGGEGVLPALGAVHDRRPGALGIGAAGRLAVQLAPPGQEGGVGQIVAARRHLLGHGRHPGGPARRLGCAGSASVVRNTRASAPSAKESTTTTCPGTARSSTSARASPACAAPEIADRPGQVGSDGPGGDAEPGGDRLDRPGMEAGDDGVVDVVLGHPGVLEGVGEGLTGQGDVHLLAEALLPDVRVRLAGNPPAVEELVAGRAASDELGHRAVGRRRGRPPRRRRCHAPRPRRPGRCGGRTPRPGSGAAGAAESAMQQRAERPNGERPQKS